MQRQSLIVSTIISMIIIYSAYSCSSADKKSKQNKELHIYYGYIIDRNEPFHKRILHLETLESVAKGKNIKLKREAVYYLRNARDFFSKQRQSKNNVNILSKIDDILLDLGYSIKPSLSLIEEEKKRRKKEIIKLKTENALDKRLYGNWIRRDGNKTKQYSFYSDHSFEYIEIDNEYYKRSGKKESDKGYARSIAIGKYSVREDRDGYAKRIVLNFSKKSKRGTENKEYRVEDNKLFLDEGNFLRRQ